PVPAISSVTGSDPTTCGGTDGTITINGLTAGLTYTINYNLNGTPQTGISSAALTGGVVVLTGLPAGSYSNFTATIASCTSRTFAGPVAPSPPPTPAAPAPSSNAPICSGASLNLGSGGSVPGAGYSWSGPAGFSSTAQNPVLPAATVAMSGTYQLVITVAN